MLQVESCALCETPIQSASIKHEGLLFCCHGCQVVHSILSVKNELNNPSSHPLFNHAVKSGLISNPTLLETVQKKENDLLISGVEKIYFEIQEMWCPACAEVIRLILLQNKGILRCSVDYTTDLASVTFEPKHISKDAIFSKITYLGYRPLNLETEQNNQMNKSLLLRFVVAAFCSLNLMMFSYPLYAIYFDAEITEIANLFAWFSFWASIPVLTYSAWPIFKRFRSAFSAKYFGMETLVVLGVSCAFILSLIQLGKGSFYVYFDSMSVVITFILLGKILEARAKLTTKETLFRLQRSLPRKGRKRFSDGKEHFVPIKELSNGDIVVAYTGEKIALDGSIIEGNALFNEALITGESVPLSKTIKDRVLGGSILEQGSIAYRITGKLEDSTIYKILSLIEEDFSTKTHYSQTIDTITKWFIPFLIVLAISTGFFYFSMGWHDVGEEVWQTALLRTISILLIACPCAIGIAVPLAETRIIQGLAELGIIVRNRKCLSALGEESVFVFDKTGTLTEGKFSIKSGLECLDAEIKSVLKGITSRSIHPISVAIYQNIQESPCELATIEEIVGKGLFAKNYRGDHFFLGSGVFIKEQGVIPKENRDGFNTYVYFVKNEKIQTTFILGDKIRDEAKELIQLVKPAKTVLLSGDSSACVSAIAKECGIDEWQAEYLPQEKRNFIKKLQDEGEIVGMLGDGVNDAPSLSVANVGMAVVNATDFSIQVSDLLFTTHKFTILPQARNLARKGRKIIRQNLFWAFFYNIIGVILAITGLLTPLFAAFAMMMSSLMVFFNAKRVH